jgi:6-pyruvoyltetrahydropterin/6-carboxytetrahydropterin synthase
MSKLFRITRKIELDAAHRVESHGSKCRNVHGHRYIVQATCEGHLIADGEQAGMVFDFGFLKGVMMERIHEYADHAMIAWKNDKLLDCFRQCCGKLLIIPYIPTAENLARFWFDAIVKDVNMAMGSDGHLASLRVYETPNCWADYPVPYVSTL